MLKIWSKELETLCKKAKLSSPAYNYALKALVRREYSKLELEKKLQLKEFDSSDIENAITTLIQQNYQSDERFTESLINTRVRQGKGALLIKQELRQHNIDNPDFSDIDFYELCLKVKIKKFGDKKPKDIKEKQKQVRFLQMRGFSFDEINNAIT